MSAAPLIPQAFWFRLELACPRVEGIPRESPRGRLLDLPESCLLPEVTRLEGRAPWAETRVGWNPSGLALSVEVRGKTGPIRPLDPADPEFVDRVQVWIDTRDTRDIHRATRFCHRFAATLQPAAKGKAPEVVVEQRTIHRAQADAPKARPGAILSRAQATRGGWLLELFFPAEALHGYDPETNRRLGFLIQVTDPDQGEQHLGVGREFPIGEDPSLWATLRLNDAG
jgi:hypothetical protein